VSLNGRQRRTDGVGPKQNEDAGTDSDAAPTIEQLAEMEAARKLWWNEPAARVSSVLQTMLTGHLAGTPPGETLH
jgi:hypothetical protein